MGGGSNHVTTTLTQTARANHNLRVFMKFRKSSNLFTVYHLWKEWESSAETGIRVGWGVVVGEKGSTFKPGLWPAGTLFNHRGQSCYLSNPVARSRHFLYLGSQFPSHMDFLHTFSARSTLSCLLCSRPLTAHGLNLVRSTPYIHIYVCNVYICICIEWNGCGIQKEMVMI